MAPSPSKQTKAGEYHYVKIADLHICPSANFYGRVVQAKAPRPTRGDDYIMSMVVTDESVPVRSTEPGADPDGIIINIFRPSAASFPQADPSTNDIVQFRHMRIQSYQSNIQAVSAKWSAWTVFRRVHGKWTCMPERAITAAEIERLDELDAALDNPERGGERHTMEPPAKRRQRTLQTISQVEPDTFFDLIAEVRSSQNIPSNPMTLHFDDYSTDEPISICFWDNFATEAASIPAGSIVNLSNLHARMVDGRLMASMHSDPSASRGTRIRLVEANSPLAQEMVKRRGRREERLMADEQTEALVAVVAEKVDVGIIQEDSCDPPTKLSCVAIPPTPISKVLAHPERNFKFCVKGRVVQVRPRTVMEFSRRSCSSCSTTWTEASSMTCPRCHSPWTGSHCWVFAVTLRDSTGQLDMAVCFDDGKHFLGGMEATDLERDVGARERIREVMGRLEGSKCETPFCIASYEVNGIRRYRVISTQINF